jgi:hypothetical protein
MSFSGKRFAVGFNRRVNSSKNLRALAAFFSMKINIIKHSVAKSPDLEHKFSPLAKANGKN